MKVRYTLFLILFLAVSCGVKKGTTTPETKPKKQNPIKDIRGTTQKTPAKKTSDKKRNSVDIYISKFAEIAQNQMRISKIPASITLAQGILESGVGNGRLAKDANNHFGIKCHGWKGKKIYHDDDKRQECFRKYDNAAESYDDHSKFLTKRKRYATLFELPPNDYKSWARGLRKAGYATDPKYPNKLISLIERYELFMFDSAVLGTEIMNDDSLVKVNAGVIRYTIIKGDTLFSLSKRYNTTVERIKDLNNMSTNTLSVGQEIMIPN